MKQLFQISNSDTSTAQQVLSLRLGERHACFARCNREGNILYELAYCSTTYWDKNELSQFIKSYPSLQQSTLPTRVVYDYPQSILVPSMIAQYEEKETLLNTAGFANGGSTIVNEKVPGWQLNNVYAVPGEVQDWVKDNFPAATFHHQYSVDMRNMEENTPHGGLAVDFRSEDFTVLAARDGQVILTQNFPYTTPDDVLYYLLRICQQCSFNQQTLQLSLSGLIDKQSSLYNELFQYFIHTRFRESTWTETAGYPPHFFTSLNDLARCAS